jgi:uncharacterized protein (UPF0248 family)
MQNSESNPSDFKQIAEAYIQKSAEIQYFSPLRELLKTSSPIKIIKQINQEIIIELVNGQEIPLHNIININEHFAPQFKDYQSIIACRC